MSFYSVILKGSQRSSKFLSLVFSLLFQRALATPGGLSHLWVNPSKTHHPQPTSQCPSPSPLRCSLSVLCSPVSGTEADGPGDHIDRCVGTQASQSKVWVVTAFCSSYTLTRIEVAHVECSLLCSFFNPAQVLLGSVCHSYYMRPHFILGGFRRSD